MIRWYAYHKNIISYEKSFAKDVITLESAVSAIAGKAFLSILNRPTNSAAMCCASVALPPFPNNYILLFFLIHSAIITAACSI